MKFGDIELDVISGGRFRLDGGAMFGIIPRPLWERVAPPDERNRIQLDANCVVIRVGAEIVLVDTGNGAKMDTKERDIFDLEAGNPLLQNLKRLGLRPEDITIVLLTHLHMDHVGGGTLLTPGGNVVPTFPNARYLVQRLEWDDALHNRSHMRVSYRTENLLPIQDAGALELLEGDTEIVPGVRTLVTPGHTRAHQSVRIDSGGQTVFCFGDLCPTTQHLRGPYNMGYDLAPYETMTRKLPLIEQSARENWIIVWDHDPDIAIGRITEEEGRYRAVALDEA